MLRIENVMRSDRQPLLAAVELSRNEQKLARCLAAFQVAMRLLRLFELIDMFNARNLRIEIRESTNRAPKTHNGKLKADGSNHSARRAAATGRRAARMAGGTPPTTPISRAKRRPERSKTGVTRKANAR